MTRFKHPRNRWDRCAACGSTEVRHLGLSAQGKTAYLGCAACGYTWSTRVVERVRYIPRSDFHAMREIRRNRA